MPRLVTMAKDVVVTVRPAGGSGLGPNPDNPWQYIPTVAPSVFFVYTYCVHGLFGIEPTG